MKFIGKMWSGFNTVESYEVNIWVSVQFRSENI